MKQTPKEFLAAKGRRRLGFLTCYDSPMAKAFADANLDGLLVGDSLGEVLYGMENTTFVTLDMMVLHTRAVASAAGNKIHVMADLPFGTYDSPGQALASASSLTNAGADSVKLETPTSEVVVALCEAGMSVCGHVGLTPQTNFVYKQQGRTREERERILRDAERLAEAGCFMIVVEAVPGRLAEEITKSVPVPTIGIAAGTNCDGEIRVHYDMLGWTTEGRSYVVRYGDAFAAAQSAAERFAQNVLEGKPA